MTAPALTSSSPTPQTRLAGIVQLRDELVALSNAANHTTVHPIVSDDLHGPQPISYAIGTFAWPAQTMNEIGENVGKLLVLLAPTATVSTLAGGVVATSRIQYRSWAATAFSTNATRHAAAQHLDEIAAAFAYRTAMAGAIAAASSAIVGISAAASNPLLLPHAIALLFQLKDKVDRLLQAATEVLLQPARNLIP